MTPPAFIRTSVFRMSQGDFASVLGTSQSRVSDWESKGYIPATMQPLVRLNGAELCRMRGQAWCDSWFFEVPPELTAMGQPSHIPAQPGITS